MSCAELLARLYKLNGRVWLKDGRVRVSAPQGVLSTEFWCELRARKEELRQWLECRSAEGTARLPLVSYTRPERVPLSFAQARLWFLHRLEGSSATYNIPLALRLEGDLAATALEAALVDVVARHESLRTIFPEEDGIPFQRVLAAGEARPVLVTERVSEATLSVRLAEAAATAIDLSREIPMRAWLFKLELQCHVLLLLLHHIAGDGWSLGPLALDLSRAYAARACGEAPDFVELPVQYADYALWQREMDDDPNSRLARELSFWRAALAGLPEGLSLPTDRARPPLASYRGAMVPVSLDIGLHGRMLELARSSEASLFMVLQAGLAALLSRLGAGEDIPIGSPIAGRSEPALWDLVGFFVNTLVLRTDVSGDPTFRELIGRVRAFDLEAFAHQEVPFERVVDALHPERSVARHPLFQVMLVLQNAPVSNLTFRDLVVRAEPLESKTAKFDLTLTLAERYGSRGEPLGIEGGLEYSLDLFGRESAVEMIARFARLLRAAVETPNMPLHRLEILGPGDRNTLLKCFNATKQMMPKATLSDLFEVQVALEPEAVALVFGEESLSYSELNTKANRLAHYLIELGAGPESIVGIAFNRSIDLVVALVATVKAGAAYLPLDPNYPVERLERMLRDAAPTVVISTSTLQERLLKTVVILTLDRPEVQDTLGQRPGNNPSDAVRTCALSPWHPAYVNYTSGSTGQPKGVLVPQGAVVSLVRQPNYVRLDRASRLLQLAPLSFDAATFEIWGALLNGGVLVIAPPGPLSSEEIGGLLERQRVNTLWLTAGLFHQMVDSALTAFAGVEQVLAGGDVVSAEHVQKVRRAHPRCQVINGYGPTENTTFSCCYTVRAGADLSRGVPIGAPIGNRRAYVLDGALEPVALGVSGELYVAGEGLARGYVNQPGLTAERFVADPYGQPGARMYRSGDLARWRADGTLEFLGRYDQQVKVRGFRIELGEVEAVLTTHPTVEQATVVAGDDNQGGRRLVAYVVPAPGATLGSAALRRALGEQLPDYMVPATFVILDTLPLTPNGKVDRSALPPPHFSAQALSGAYAPPLTHNEKILAEIWAERLPVDRVGIHDNFFELGGDSILSIQIISRARARNLKISVREMFTHQTIHELAAVAQPLSEPPSENAVDAIGEVPLTPIVQWFFELALPRPEYFTQVVMLKFPADVPPARLREAAAAIGLRHPALRLRYRYDGTGWHQVYGEGPLELPFAVEDVSTVAEPDLAVTIADRCNQALASLDLEHGPLWRMVWFNLGAGREPRLLWVIHHLAVDGVSWRLLLEELATACAQVERLEPVDLGPTPTLISAWACHLERIAGSERLAAAADNWLNLDVARLRPLMLDYPESRTRNTNASSRIVSLCLTEAETRGLLRNAAIAYRARVDEVLLAALVESLSDFMGGDGIWVDLEGHGREELLDAPDVSRTVGWFTAVYPAFLRRHSSGQLVEQLKLTKEELRSVPERGIAYGVLRYLSPDPSQRQALARLPSRDVVFNYLGQFSEQPEQAAAFTFVGEGLGSAHAPEASMTHLLEVSMAVYNSRLTMQWIYSEEVHRRATVEGLANDYRRTLIELIDHCGSSHAGSCTPSEFPDLGLDQATLDRLIARACRGYASNNVAVAIETLYPLSYNQQGMLFESLAAPSSGVHIEQSVQELNGELNLGAYQAAWQAVLDRHSALRTSFEWDAASEPFQIVHRKVELEIRKRDWRALPARQQEEQLASYLRVDRLRGFELDRVPLMRLAWFWTGEQSHIFVWTLHHIVVDGWSLPMILTDLREFYTALTADTRAPSKPVRQFGDYIAWLRRQNFADAESFWRRHLRGFRTSTPLGSLGVPCASDDIAVSDASHAQLTRELASSLTTELDRGLRKRRLTLSTVMQGVWALLLGRYSGMNDVVFGVTVSGRPSELEGIETMVGLFSTSLPLRIEIPTNGEVWPWLQKIQTDGVTRRAYEYCSAGQIHQWSELAISEPLYESLLVIENYPNETLRSNPSTSIRVDQLYHQGAQTRHPLVLLIIPGSALRLTVVFDHRRIDASRAADMLTHVQRMLERLGSRPETTLDELGKLVVEEEVPKIQPNAPKTAAQSSRSARPLPPRDILELELLKLWRELLNLDAIGIQDSFFVLGGHSLVALRLMSAIRQRFGKDFDMSLLFQADTVEKLASVIRRTTAAAPWSPLVPIRGGTSLRPIFCVHPAGGNVLCYAELAAELDMEQPIYGLQSQEVDEQALDSHNSMEEMADVYLATVRAVQPKGPYLLAGWSFGGVLAFAMAQRLYEEGEEVPILALLDSFAPSCTPYRGEIDSIAALFGFVGGELDLSPDELRRLDAEARVVAVLRRAHELNLIPSEFGPAQARRFLELQQRIRAALANYRPRPFSGTVQLFRCRDETLPELLRITDPHLGWGEFIRGEIELYWVPGDHHNMVYRPYVKQLAAKLRECLAQVHSTFPWP